MRKKPLKSLILLILVLIILTLSIHIVIPVAEANEWKILKTEYKVGPEIIKFSDQVLISKGRCSCNLKNNYSLLKLSKFKNYCPYCHHNGTMDYEEGPPSWTCPEGMWYCTRCDTDFCLQCGKEHRIKSPKYLKKILKKGGKNYEN